LEAWRRYVFVVNSTGSKLHGFSLYLWPEELTADSCKVWLSTSSLESVDYCQTSTGISSDTWTVPILYHLNQQAAAQRRQKDELSTIICELVVIY